MTDIDGFLDSGPISQHYDEKTGKLTPEGEALIASALDLLQAVCWTITEAHGFHDDDRKFPEEIALMHSELSEALESWRSSEPALWFRTQDGQHTAKPYGEDDKVNKAEGMFAELGDTIIRICDSAEAQQRVGFHASLAEAVIYKLRYNLGRPYKHGKIA